MTRKPTHCVPESGGLKLWQSLLKKSSPCRKGRRGTGVGEQKRVRGEYENFIMSPIKYYF
jgi:hypothetical protein